MNREWEKKNDLKDTHSLVTKTNFGEGHIEEVGGGASDTNLDK